MRRPLIAGNWKMHGTIAEAVELARRTLGALEGGPADGVEVVVCPPFLALAPVREVLDGSRIGLGAQDMHWEASGAYTGEVSPAMLRDVGVTHVILGHSERRHIMGESNEHVNRKVKAALANGLAPIVCVGELLEERSMGDTYAVVERQTVRALDAVPPGDLERVAVAYEPVWAIGTGKTAKPEQARDVHRYVRKLVARMAGEEVASRVRILYGGSVKPDNIRDLMAQPDVDGALVGGASLEAESFSRIVRYNS